MCQATRVLWAPEGNVPGNVPGNVSGSREIGSPGSEPLARARQLFYGFPKATCQATPGNVPGNIRHSGSTSGTCPATVLWAPEGDVPGNVPGNVRHSGSSRHAPFRLWKAGKGPAREIAGSLGSLWGQHSRHVPGIFLPVLGPKPTAAGLR